MGETVSIPHWLDHLLYATASFLSPLYMLNVPQPSPQKNGSLCHCFLDSAVGFAVSIIQREALKVNELNRKRAQRIYK